MAETAFDEARGMTPEQALAMSGAFRAFRRTDGELIGPDYDWVAGDYDCGGRYGDDSTEIEEVVMVPVHVRNFMCHEAVEGEESDD